MSNITYDMTDTQLSELSRLAIEAKKNAYCPYSQFRVGAALLCEDDSFVTGANVENASYPVGVCAERTAIVKAVTEGKTKFKALAVATDISPAASPCGMCRQFIREFCHPDLPIYMHDKDGKHVMMTLNDLLPMSFGPEKLPSPETLLANRPKDG